MATRGRKFNALNRGASQLTGTNGKIILVLRWETNQPAIRVNAGVPDGFFDLWRNLPPGTHLGDQDKDESKIVFLNENAEKK